MGPWAPAGDFLNSLAHCIYIYIYIYINRNNKHHHKQQRKQSTKSSPQSNITTNNHQQQINKNTPPHIDSKTTSKPCIQQPQQTSNDTANQTRATSQPTSKPCQPARQIYFNIITTYTICATPVNYKHVSKHTLILINACLSISSPRSAQTTPSSSSSFWAAQTTRTAPQSTSKTCTSLIGRATHA